MINSQSVPVGTVVSEHGSSSDAVIDVMAAGVVVLLAFFNCFVASMGNLFSPPQRLHLTTSISAQGFLPPLLGFTMTWVAVRPGMRTALQLLHMERFKSTASRNWPFRDTCCMSEQSSSASGDCL